MEKRWRRLARRRGVSSSVQWLGQLRRDDALNQFRWADVFAFTSLRDTTGTVILEALAAGLPVVCLDHQGARDVIRDDCGIRVPVTSPRQTVRALSRALRELAIDDLRRRRMANAASRRAREYLWSRHGEALREVYKGVVLENEENRAEPYPAQDRLTGGAT